jgi:hypothetical protein
VPGSTRPRSAFGRRAIAAPGGRLEGSPGAGSGARPACPACVCKPLSRCRRGALELSQSRRARAGRAAADDTRPVEVEPVPVVARLGLELLQLDVRGRSGRPASGRRRPGLLGLTRHRLPAHPVAYRPQQPAPGAHVPAREELHSSIAVTCVVSRPRRSTSHGSRWTCPGHGWTRSACGATFLWRGGAFVAEDEAVRGDRRRAFSRAGALREVASQER